MEYPLCISFAGTDREYARQLATEIRDRGIKVFFDEFEKTRLWGTFLHDSLGKIYYDAYYAIVLLSNEYYIRMYTNVERKALLLDERGKEKILPIRMDDSEIPIALKGIGYLSSDKESVESIAELAVAKVNSNSTILKDSISTLLGRQDYDKVLQIGEKFLEQYDTNSDNRVGSGAPTYGFILYNTACAYSKLGSKIRDDHGFYRVHG